jgi:hypothetical protein
MVSQSTEKVLGRLFLQETIHVIRRAEWPQAELVQSIFFVLKKVTGGMVLKMPCIEGMGTPKIALKNAPCWY